MKNNSTQHSLSSMLEIRNKILDGVGHIYAIFVDLSKTFDTLNTNLLIDKLEAHGFENKHSEIYENFFKEQNTNGKSEKNFK